MVKAWFIGAAAIAAGMLAVGAASAQIYEQKYVVEAVITPLADEQSPIKISEVWETVAYRDLARFHTVVRVFGEALHFVYDGEDYFLLKRGANNSSAGSFDPMRECLGIKHLSDYESAPRLAEECRIAARSPMVVKVDADGRIERIVRPGSMVPYPLFSVDVFVRPAETKPSYELAARFPWIGDLAPYEDSVLPTKIPEEGNFVSAKHYKKDFVVNE